MNDWDDAFDNMGYIPGALEQLDQWAADAQAFRAGSVQIETDIPYGPSDREKFDLIWPDGTPKGLMVFVHGGYWMRLSKSSFTHLAEGARANRWAVVIPSYTLAPQARLTQIAQQISVAITKAAKRVSGPIHLTGHSAGGHLVTRVSQPGIMDEATQARIDHILPISGLFDLRPLLQTKMNETLNLDAAETLTESPALLTPVNVQMTIWVGGGERPEFIRQSKLYDQHCKTHNLEPKLVIDGSHNHFTVVDGLRQSDSLITRALLA